MSHLPRQSELMSSWLSLAVLVSPLRISFRLIFTLLSSQLWPVDIQTNTQYNISAPCAGQCLSQFGNFINNQAILTAKLWDIIIAQNIPYGQSSAKLPVIMSTGQLVIWSSGYPVIQSSSHPVIRSSCHPIVFNITTNTPLGLPGMLRRQQAEYLSLYL